MRKTLIQLKNITKTFDEHMVLNHVSLNIHKNEFITLLGPSGCGKTTLLRILAGFETPDSGLVLYNNHDILNLPPYERNINTVFQKYALFPHLNVFDNIAFGLKIRKLDKSTIKSKVLTALAQVNLIGYEKRSISKLSGGQQQRVAIARAIVNEPEILLLDEPLGALDLKLRKEMQFELKKLQQELGITFIYVTHDQEEALTMSDTVVVLNDGIIQQKGNPEDIYSEPTNAFVADFIGESNIFTGTMVKDKVLDLLGHTLECVDVGFEPYESVDVVIRPEDIDLLQIEEDTDKKQYITGTVTDSIFKGVHYETRILTNNHSWFVHSTKNYPIGKEMVLHVIPFNIHVMKKVIQYES